MLKETTKNNFSLRIINYEFPEIISEPFDSDWLTIEMSATFKGRSWSVKDPCLLTWELKELIEWLDSFTVNNELIRSISFIEPNLSFNFVERTSNYVIIEVVFEQECKPPWVIAENISRFKAQFTYSIEELKTWVDDLMGQLAKYPIRWAGDNK